MDTIKMKHMKERPCHTMVTQDNRHVMRYLEKDTWDITWYQDMCTGDGWQRMNLSEEEYQALNMGLMDYLEANKPEEIVYGFCYEDVQDLREDLTKEQAMEVLRRCERYFDASIGLNWDVIQHHAQDLYPEPRES